MKPCSSKPEKKGTVKGFVFLLLAFSLSKADSVFNCYVVLLLIKQ